MKLLNACLLGIIMLTMVCVQHLKAAPFSRTLEFTQPDGLVIRLFAEGDDFHAVFETLDGYTVVFDENLGAYVYAVLNGDSSELVTTGLVVGSDPVGAFNKHLRITRDAMLAKAAVLQNLWEAETGIIDQWENLKLSRLSNSQALSQGPIAMAPPTWHTLGEVTGLCLLIDFTDDPATIEQSEINDYCNKPGYDGYKNKGSVRDYYLENSGGMLQYTNIVTAYITMVKPKSYYNNIYEDAGFNANELIRDALTILKELPNYEDEIAPQIDQLSLGDDGWARALNVFYAGGNGGRWAMGLWPHQWQLIDFDLFEGGFAPDPFELTERTSVCVYQITDISDELNIGTFCHENGHMICDFPDLYDYDYDSIGGAGKFCLMGSGATDKNPVQINAYLKYAAGWTTTIEVAADDKEEASATGIMDSPDFNKIYKVPHPTIETEYYLFEVRNKVGRDAGIPGEGLLIWHIDELGDRDNQSVKYNSSHQNYECSLVQADNLKNFQNNNNSGDATDPFYAGNPAETYSNELSDLTRPSARWWSGKFSGMRVQDISTKGETMTFLLQPFDPVMLTEAGPLPHGRELTPYNHAIGVYGGSKIIYWSIVNGSLPEGLTMDSNGVISGTPTMATKVSFDVQVLTTYGVAVVNTFSLEVLSVNAAPYYEGFDLSSALPDSWTQEYLTNTVSWAVIENNNSNPSVPQSGSNMACFYTTLGGSPVTRLITPLIDFGDQARGGRLSFWHYMAAWSDRQDQMRVLYKTVAGNEWTLLATYTASQVGWAERVIDLPEISRTVYIAFEGTSWVGRGVCIDTINVWDPTPLYGIINPDPLPSAIINEPYEVTLLAEGGYAPYTFSVVSNALPLGMVLTPSGVITGVVSEVQIVNVCIQVMDDEGATAYKNYSISVTMPLVEMFKESFDLGLIPTGWAFEHVDHTTAWVVSQGGYMSHPAAAAHGAYNMMFQANTWQGLEYADYITKLVTPEIDLGQNPSHITLTFWHCMEKYSLQQDELRVYYRTSEDAAWINIATYDANTPAWTKRTLSLPDPSRSYYIAFEGLTRFGYGVCIDDIRICDESAAPVVRTSYELPDGSVAVEYAAALTASGGVLPYTWEAVSALPSGLILSVDGAITGVPDLQYNGEITIRVVGADLVASTNTFKIRVEPVPVVPFFEDFENDGNIPRGWTQQIRAGYTPWLFQSGTPCTQNDARPKLPNGGSYNAGVYTSDPANDNVVRLISPRLDLGDGTSNTVLKFWQCTKYIPAKFGDQLRLFYRTTPNGTWMSLTNFPAVDTPDWTERTVALPNPSSSYFIAFEAWTKSSYGICIDDVTVTGDRPLSPYESWLTDNFTELEIENGFITGYYDDPEGDLILNIWEYAFGLSPRVFNSSGTPTGGVFNNYLQLSYRQNADATDLEFIVEACTDLVVGDWSTNEVSEFLRTDRGGYWDVTMQHDVPATNAPTRFMRLNLIVN